MENALKAFNDAALAMSKLSEEMAAAQEEFNSNIDETNEMVDLLEKFDEQKVHDENNAKTLVSNLQQKIVELEKIVEIQSKNFDQLQFKNNQTSVELRELRALDPKGLVKTNKTLKKKNAELTTRLVNSEKTRKEALAQHKVMLKKKQDEGIVCVHSDPETGNQLKMLPSLKVSKTNTYGGMPNTPVIEFFHKSSGVSRQGTLLKDGDMGWGSAANSKPSKQESKIAKLKIVEFCEARNIKLKVNNDG